MFIFISCDPWTTKPVHKGQFFEIEIYTSSESWINKLSLMYGCHSYGLFVVFSPPYLVVISTPTYSQVCSFCFRPVLWMLPRVCVSLPCLEITCHGIIKVCLNLFIFIVLPLPTHRTVTEYQTETKKEK